MISQFFFWRRETMAEKQARARLNAAIRREYQQSRPSLACRLFSGDLFGLSIRPDLTSYDSRQCIQDAEWALFDAWVDVGQVMSQAMHDFRAQHAEQLTDLGRTR